ncbi:MAG: hypothetical protein V2B18_12965 [Pseudomonadota bacterium]
MKGAAKEARFMIVAGVAFLAHRSYISPKHRDDLAYNGVRPLNHPSLTAQKRRT